MQLTSFTDITSNYQHIYISPHFDDVVYSCGGTIGLQSRQGQRPLVITVFAGIPPSERKLSSFALKMHKRMGFYQDAATVITSRRQEDANALTYLQADYLWLNYVDALYRGVPAHYKHRWSICGKVHPHDMWISQQLAQDLLTIHKQLPEATWYAPLSMGNHVDHQIVFAAVQPLLHKAHVQFYEDFPYALQTRSLQQRLKRIGGTLQPMVVEISDMLHPRQQAAELYTSQLTLNFGSKELMHTSMQDYTQSMCRGKMGHVERFWITV